MLHILLPPQLNNMTVQYNVICGCECCISSKSINSYLSPWRDCFLKILKIKVIMHKTEGLVKWKILFLRPKNIMACPMEVIAIKQHQTQIWLKCVHIYHPYMNYQIMYMCYIAVHNVHLLIFQVNHYISTIQRHVLQ